MGLEGKHLWTTHHHEVFSPLRELVVECPLRMPARFGVIDQSERIKHG
jgi:hypothetical protein